MVLQSARALGSSIRHSSRREAPQTWESDLRSIGQVYSITGDVGYTRRGRFHLLFSAGIPLGSRELGVDVPATFEPLDVDSVALGGVRPPGYLHTNTIREIGVDVGGSAAVAWCVCRF
jgi:hypothetical protein